MESFGLYVWFLNASFVEVLLRLKFLAEDFWEVVLRIRYVDVWFQIAVESFDIDAL